MPTVEMLRAKADAWARDANHLRVAHPLGLLPPKAGQTFHYRPEDFILPKD